MGRRAVRKIDPTLDLSRHFKSFDDLPRPWDGAALFGREAPLEVEVGSGKGMFLLAASQQRPEVNFLGIELAFRYARFTAARLAKKRVANACVVHGDAIRVFRELLPEASLAAVHVYFPDPWWKARHKKRRVMNEAFVRRIEQVLRPGGSLQFWTDVEEYYQATLALIHNQTRLAGPFAVAEIPAGHELDFLTHFERRVRLAHQEVYRAEFRRGVEGE